MVETCDGCGRTDAQCTIRVNRIEMMGFGVGIGWATTDGLTDLHFHSRGCLVQWAQGFAWPKEGPEHAWPPDGGEERVQAAREALVAGENEAIAYLLGIPVEEVEKVTPKKGE